MRRLTHALSMERHRAMGDELKRMRDVLGHLPVELGPVYGVNSPEVWKALAAQRAVDDLRCVLDSRVFREHQEAALEIYYGGRGKAVSLRPSKFVAEEAP
jgi:hypothetical protein